MWDKIADIDVLPDGKVQSNYILAKTSEQETEAYKKYRFDSMEDYANWKAKNEEKY